MSGANLAKGSVRRLVLDISPLMAGYLLFQSALALFLDYLWVAHPFGNPMLLPGLMLALSGSMIAPRIPVWRTLPVTARDIDRARWWHSVGGPGAMLALLLAMPVAMRMAMGGRIPAWRDLGLALGGQFAVCVGMSVLYIAMPLARRKWSGWSALVLVPLLLIYVRIVMIGRGDLRPALEIVIPAAILAAIAMYLAAGRWPLPQTAAMWSAPSGAGGGAPSRLSGWPALAMASLPLWQWLWGMMAFFCLVLKWFMPGVNINLFGWIFGLTTAQAAVTQPAAAMRAFRALPLSGMRLTAILLLWLLAMQGLSLVWFQLVVQIAGGGTSPLSGFLVPLILPLVYFPALLHFGPRVAQFGFALAILVILPLQLLSHGAATAPLALALVGVVAALAVFWTWHEIARGSRAYRVQPLVPARWRGAE
jgi:hypothetical protein